ncbi:MAG: HEXXH motif-containing putative peptide modification protein [Polyangiaceae bacterium]
MSAGGIGREIRDLTIPESGSTTAREVLSQALRRLLRDAMELPRTAPGSARAEAVALHATLSAAAKGSPGALVAALRRPTVGALVRCLRPACGLPEAARDGLFVELLAGLRHDLAAAGVTLPEVRGCRRPARVLSLLDRTARDASGVSSPYHAIEGGVVLALADNNPLAMEEAHPDKEGNAIALGGKGIEAWVGALREAMGLVRGCLPELAAEIELFVHQIVPVGFDAQRHLSASYQEAIGTIYMTLHPSVMTMTEALIHEFSHNKINALFELDEVLENAWSPLYASPVRPDPRPLHGVLLAVHAFLPVARLYERMIEVGHPRAQSADFERRFAQIRKTNREGAEVVLSNGRATAVGRGVLDEIARWDAHYAKMG